MTGPFVPTPLPSPVISPEVASAFRRTPYISPSEYIAAPTAVSTTSLIPGGTAAQSLQVLADTIMRASSWVDEHCFHTADGTLAASPSTEAAWIRPKANGSLSIPCKYRPILEVDAIALGTTPGSLTSLTDASTLSIGLKTLTLPWAPLGTAAGDWPTFPIPTAYNGSVYVVWSYINGFPHTYLAASTTAGATSLTVGPSVPGGSTVYGVYPGTQMTIHDGVNTETVVVQSTSGTTLNLAAPTAHAHNMPAAPDSIRVSALPWAIEQACISLTSCLIKMRGTRAAILPMTPGASPVRDAVIQAGGLEDYETAVNLLRPFSTVFMGHN